MSEFFFGHNTGAAEQESRSHLEVGFVSDGGSGDISFPWVELDQNLIGNETASDGNNESDYTAESYQYANAASCPDCGGGMVRLGSCFNCPACGWGSCG